MGVRDSSSDGLLTDIRRTLEDREQFILLDNFEHVLDAAVLVADLLASCPGVTALVTSREPLHLRGEHVYEVPPLDRARSAGSRVELTDADAPAVAAICRRLDGLPLALELAAVQLRHLSTEGLLRALDDGLNILNQGFRDLPDRQRSMRMTISWSHSLLNVRQRRVFEPSPFSRVNSMPLPPRPLCRRILAVPTWRRCFTLWRTRAPWGTDPGQRASLPPTGGDP